MALGTVAYMSPEQALGQPVDARSDLFSLGAVLYEMVTGERAFAGTSPGAVFDRILNREPRPAARVNPSVPHELQAVLDRLLAKQPESRYASAAELLPELERVAGVLAAEEAASDVAATTSRSGRRAPQRLAGPWFAAWLLGAAGPRWRRLLRAEAPAAAHASGTRCCSPASRTRRARRSSTRRCRRRSRCSSASRRS